MNNKVKLDVSYSPMKVTFFTNAIRTQASHNNRLYEFYNRRELEVYYDKLFRYKTHFGSYPNFMTYIVMPTRNFIRIDAWPKKILRKHCKFCLHGNNMRIMPRLNTYFIAAVVKQLFK